MDEDTMFCGQISSVYLFSEAILPQQVAALHALGPAYKVLINHMIPLSCSRIR